MFAKPKPSTSASSWTGAIDTIYSGDTITAPRPKLTSEVPKPKPIKAAVKSHMDEYAELAAMVGVKAPDLGIEAFKAFLEQHNITVFSLQAVISYMDKKAVEESKNQAGWEWRPLRDKDNRPKITFGTPGRRSSNHSFGQGSTLAIDQRASDYYKGTESTVMLGQDPSTGQFVNRTVSSPGSSQPYDRHIPLHALRKVALIEKEYKGDAAFFVSDYALAPQIEYPDPFLLVVVPNLDVNKGVGRLVIDFWDEPGFGLDKQLQG